MPLTIEDARFVSDCRLQIIQNTEAGKPPSEGIDEDRLRAALDLVRQEMTIGAASAAKKKKSAAAVVPIDLDALMGKKAK